MYSAIFNLFLKHMICQSFVFVSKQILLFYLSQEGIGLNRKVLADLAMNHPETFNAVVDSVKK
jgi:ribosomal protein L20